MLLNDVLVLLLLPRLLACWHFLEPIKSGLVQNQNDIQSQTQIWLDPRSKYGLVTDPSVIPLQSLIFRWDSVLDLHLIRSQACMILPKKNPNVMANIEHGYHNGLYVFLWCSSGEENKGYEKKVKGCENIFWKFKGWKNIRRKIRGGKFFATFREKTPTGYPNLKMTRP